MPAPADPLAYLDAPAALTSLARRVASAVERPDGTSFDDAVQDASVIILQWRPKVHTHSPDNFRTPALFYRRVCLDLRKQYERAAGKNAKRRAAESAYARPLDAVVRRPDQSDDPTPALQTSIDVHEAIAKLPPRLARVVTAIFLEGRTQNEVARELGTNQSAVSQLLARGKRALRAYLGADYMENV